MLNKEVLTKLDDLSAESMSSILEALDSLRVSELLEAQVFPGRAGKTIAVKDISGKNYYIGLSEYGFVEIVRSDSTTGEIVYMPIDD
ncbi:MAG: hypothetical protein Q4A30_02700 [Candidatus Saccharibacteria bacterium]|nr:hypothetical protein [Candidatus Saccharibacteria bacterium]